MVVVGIAKSRLIFLCLFLSFCCVACAQSDDVGVFHKAQAQTVLLNDSSQMLPLKALDKPIYYANLGDPDSVILLQILRKYAPVRSLCFSLSDFQGLKNKIQPKSIFILSIYRVSVMQNQQIVALLNSLQNLGMRVVLVSSQDLGMLPQFDDAHFPILWSPLERQSDDASFVAQVIMGGKSVNARLSQTYSSRFVAGMGTNTHKTRLGYSNLTYLGYDANALSSLDQLAAEAIAAHATPGLSVAVVKNGEMVFQKAYGHFTYDNNELQSIQSVFDLASVTKIMATTPEVMKLVSEGMIRLDDKISQYLPEFKGKPAQEVTIQEVMLHEAGFVPFIPFYKNLKKTDYAADSSAAYPTKVAPHYYLRKKYFEEVMWPQMINSPLKNRGTYVYSDISMYVMRAIIERVTKHALPALLNADFYKPLGLQYTTFNAWKYLPISQITPTEDDSYFRHALLRGYVHDQGAAMAGGVSGHAGLFSTTNDMAIFFDMLLQKGRYGGTTYLDSSVVEKFTDQFHAKSRRGLGFDKREIKPDSEYPCKYATEALYGHTGYTGTCVWVDPTHQFIFIFLSNRVYPKVSTTLSRLKTREKMLDEIYHTFVSE